MSLSLELSQKQTLSQRTLQMLSVLQMSAQEVESYIENAAMENPVIELSDKGFSAREEHPLKSYQDTSEDKKADIMRKLEWLSQSDRQNKVYYQQDADDDSKEDWYGASASEETLADYLSSQLLLHTYSKIEKGISDYIINSLDSNGYLKEDTKSIADFFSIPEKTVLKLLKDIQKLDPAGVGARDLSECIILQLERLDEHNDIVYEIVKNHLEDLAKNHIDIIARKMKADHSEVLSACNVIRAVNPKPGSSFSSREQLRYIRPDVFIVKTENNFEILVNEYRFPSISISVEYKNLLNKTDDKETRDYLKAKITEAENIIRNIEQRSSTLSSVSRELVAWQMEFFLYGPGHLRPMKLSDLAKKLDVHESTISRTLSSKYLQCIWGVFPMSYFLVASVQPSGRISNPSGETAEITQDEVLSALKKLINEEDKKKPLSDQKLSDALSKEGFEISRRTVTKYRSILGFPDKSGRKISK